MANQKLKLEQKLDAQERKYGSTQDLNIIRWFLSGAETQMQWVSFISYGFDEGDTLYKPSEAMRALYYSKPYKED